MKITLSIESNDEPALLNKIRGDDWANAMHTFYQESLRRRIKYTELSEEVNDVVEQIKNEFIDLLRDQNLEFD